jgi:hypothetical protein
MPVSLCSPWHHVPRRLAWPPLVLSYHSTPKSAHTTRVVSPSAAQSPCPTKVTSLSPMCFPRGIAPPPSPSKVWKRANLHLPNTGTPQVLARHTHAACMNAPIRTCRALSPKEHKEQTNIILPTPACAFPSLNGPHAARMHAEQNTRSFACSWQACARVLLIVATRSDRGHDEL